MNVARSRRTREPRRRSTTDHCSFRSGRAAPASSRRMTRAPADVWRSSPRGEMPEGTASSTGLAAALLTPFDAMIASALRVRFAVPAGRFDDIPLHLLPWRGRPLIASVEVEHSIATVPFQGEPPCDGAALVHAL